MNNGNPLWATPDRQAKLAELFAQKLPEVTAEFYQNLGTVIMDGVPMAEFLNMLTKDIGHSFIEYWKEDDRDQRSFLWRLEKRRMHANPRKLGKRGGPYDSIHREQLHAERPVFEVLGIGVSAFTQHRVAKVRITELKKIVWVDLFAVDIPRRKLRKIARRLARGRGEVPAELFSAIKRGVRRYI